MGFLDRSYDVYVILGHPDSTPIWTDSAWVEAARVLDPLVAAAWDRAAVRSTQLRASAGSPNQRAISFGRLGWNQKSHGKWVQGPGAIAESREFLDVEVWAPTWTICESERQPPDLFFGCRSELSPHLPRLAFNQYLVLAAAVDQVPEVRALAEQAARDLAGQVNAVLQACRQRNWSYPFGDPDSETAIGDYLVNSPFRTGPIHSWEPSLEVFKRAWSPF